MPLRVKNEAELLRMLKIPEQKVDTPPPQPYVAPPAPPRPRKPPQATSNGFLWAVFFAAGFMVGFLYGLRF